MRAGRWSVGLLIAVAVAVATASAEDAAAAAAADPPPHESVAATTGTWGTAQEVPGMAALNKLVDATVTSVSCTGATSCSAVGVYPNGLGGVEAFVTRRVNGNWGTAVEVPGTLALDPTGTHTVHPYSLSCSSAGNCGLTGSYTDAHQRLQAFVDSEVNGQWRTAIEVPGTNALNQYGDGGGTSISCKSPGNCSAVGEYTNSSGHNEAFVVSEVNGTWRTAVEVPGSAALNHGNNGTVDAVSCASPGNCSAVGSMDTAPMGIAFVVNEVNGWWQTAIQVPGVSTMDQGGMAVVTSVSCAKSANCSAGGNYSDTHGGLGAFVVSEVNGIWRTAIKVPGMTDVNSMSCGSAGNCSAGGDSYSQTALVVNEVNGIWHAAIQVLGTATLDHGQNALVTSVSCPSAGNCAAGGNYWYNATAGSFVVNEVNGTWHTAIQVPGLAALQHGSGASLNSLSCSAAGICSAGGNVGYYGYYGSQPFVVSKN